MTRWIFAIVLLAAASAEAQTFYAPATYQYQTSNGVAFYYGGTNARVFETADRAACVDARLRVFSDCRGWLGYESDVLTPDDARNQAYAGVPRYFRKSDERGFRLLDGSIVVPIRPTAGAGTIEIKPYVRPPKATTTPILIIPKDLLIPAKPSDKTVASAR